MLIKKYKMEEDEFQLIRLLENEGEEWSCYTAVDKSDKYKEALNNSITYVAYEDDILCGYSRSLKDFDFYIYICDLLVVPEYRGRNIGRELMECIYNDYPEHIVYVMSDVDIYYEKQGYKREGSVFEVTKDREM
ncbi:MAG: GNAT family N-acetyltransferase [Halanaerobiales bacterium]